MIRKEWFCKINSGGSKLKKLPVRDEYIELDNFQKFFKFIGVAIRAGKLFT
jgi:hypothetical protein